jgi:hypothetical protein
MSLYFAPFVTGRFMPREENMSYLVRFSEQYFYSARSVSGVRALGTKFPSVALQMNYLVAVEVAKRLRDLGYPDSVVTDLYGAPVTAEALEQTPEDASATYDFAQAWNRLVATEN